jgi:2-desacetyl-2-hydroxyethyl bacteriochlorophyllide A dehydrogenase
MAAALYFTAPETVAVRSVSVDAPGTGEVVVETECSGISAGSELLVYRGEAPETLDATLPAVDDLSYPLRYGYAAVGRVRETGPGVDPDWQGRRVFALHPHQTRFSAAVDDLIPVPERIDTAAATLFPSVETATNFLLDGQPTPGERVVVFGAGVVGLCTVSLLADFPLERLVVADPVTERRERARAFGADAAVPPDEVAAALPDDDPDGADLVYELSGDPATLDAAIEVAGYDARVVVGSWYGNRRAPVDLGGSFHRDRLSIVSSQVSTIDPSLRGRWTHDRRRAVAFDRLHRMDTDSLVTHRLPFTDADRAYQRLAAAPDDTLQVLLTYNGHDDSTDV